VAGDTPLMRIPRLNVPGVVYHLIWRFVDREWFFSDDSEREMYLRLLAIALDESDWRCLAYALMSNHIHLAMVAGADPMWTWTKRVSSPFANWMNQRHGRLGPLMADRPKQHAILREKEGALIAYIHNNPVRAGVVTTPLRSRWTSHLFYVSSPPPPWLYVAEGLTRAGFEDGKAFDRWVRSTPGESGEVEINELKKVLHKRGALEAANLTKLGERARVDIVSRRDGHARIEAGAVIKLVADTVDVDDAALRSRRRTSALVSARRVAVHLAKSLGLTGSEIASALGITRQAVSRLGLRALDGDDSQLLDLVREQARFRLSTLSR
jgi:REP element-mobilizing transposase RayT